MSSNAPKPTLIAVVDDEECVRRALERLLRAAGYAVATHASGADFLDALRHRLSACVVLDLHMPEVDGFEVLEALRTQPDSPPVLVVTADLSPGAVERATRLGAVACLSKPVDGAALLGAIGAALGSKRC